MENNIFSFGDLYFLQLLGTAMGTSAACMWATIYYAIHEMDTLLPTHGPRLLLLCRFIDDMIGIWTGTSAQWEVFKKDVNDFGLLTWDIEDPTTTVDFLDLTIRIENNKITTKTYQKELNLYQYIPPRSCHPPGMMEGIVYSLMRTYRRHNTKTSDYYDMATKLFHRHVARGWDKAVMKEYILKADHKLNSFSGNGPYMGHTFLLAS